MQDQELKVSLAKNELRRQLKPQRETITSEEYEASRSKIAEIDLAPLSITSEKIVAGYYPVRREINCIKLLEKLHGRQITIALPVVRGDELSLHFKKWSPGDALKKGQLNILEPEGDAPNVTPDILFIPLLAFDKKGYRLGYGKGHYDRTLAELQNNASVTAVGIAYDTQEIPEVPFDQYDQRLDWILTQSGLRKLGE